MLNYLTPEAFESIKTELELIAIQAKRGELEQNELAKLLSSLNCIKIFTEKAIYTLEQEGVKNA